MVVHGVYIVSKSGGLIFNHDHNVPKVDTEKVFNYPIDLKLDFDSKNVTVLFGQKDGINGWYSKWNYVFVFLESLHFSSFHLNLHRFISILTIFSLFSQILLTVGHVLMTLNGIPVNGTVLEDGRPVRDIIENASEYPLTLKFARPKMTTNEKIFLASMFYPLFAIASQLSPEPKSSGIEVLEADTFKLNCFQTLTG